MNWIRYLIFGLIVSVCATAAFFAKDVVNWLNEAASFLTASIVIPANIFNMIIGLLVMIGGLVLFWERKTARFDWRTFGKAVFAFGAFVVLYNFLEAAQAFIVWASLALAFAAFLSFGESRELRRANFDREARDREERLLNEIIEWATDITKKQYEKDLRTVLGAPDVGKVRLSVYGHIAEVKESLLALRGKDVYITEITRKFDSDLRKAVAEVIALLIGYIQLLDEWQNEMAKDIAKDVTDRANVADAYWSRLAKASYEVIAKATRLKTEHID